MAKLRGRPTHCTGVLDASALDRLMPAGGAWADLREVLAEVWGGARAQTYKPSTMLFAHVGGEGGSEGAAGAAAALAAAGRRPGDDCLLQLDAGSLPADRGVLQQTLAEFLRWVGGWVVVWGGWEVYVCVRLCVCVEGGGLSACLGACLRVAGQWNCGAAAAGCGGR